MKKLSLIIGTLCCLLSTSAFAQFKLMKDPQGVILGYEDERGTIYNNASVPIINMKDSLTVIVSTGDTLAQYNARARSFSYATGELIFKLNARNEVINASGNTVGKIDEQGNVYGADSKLKAIARGITPFKLAYYFFFVNK